MIHYGEHSTSSSYQLGTPSLYFYRFKKVNIPGLCFRCCSVAKSCPSLFGPMNGSTPGSSVLHCLPMFAQIQVLWAMLSNYHILYLPASPFTFNLSQNQGLFQWVGSSHQCWSFSISWRRRRQRQTTSVFLPWEPHEQCEKAKRYDTRTWVTRSEGVPGLKPYELGVCYRS